MRKLLLAFLVILISISNVMAKSVNRTFSNVINASDIEKNSISISIKDLTSGKSIYELNSKILMHPASVQKILTIVPAIEVLGNDYKFETSIYSRSDDEYLIKLGADPFLSSGDLKKLVNNVKRETKKIYIDDSIIEAKSWGEGWQWDDDLNISMPRFNTYNLDKNLIKLTIMPPENGENAVIINPSKYPLVFLNNMKAGDKNSIKVTRDNSISNNTLELSGTVNKPAIVYIPSNNLKRYFNVKLTNLLENKKIYLKQNYITDKVKDSDKLIDSVEHPIEDCIDEILKNSNNMVAETVSKVASAKAYSEKGTDTLAIKMFDEYCKKNNLDNSRIKLVDASGISKNNLVTSDFVTDFLVFNKENSTLKKMAKPGEGTLLRRMLPIKDNLRAKTGTLSDISAIAGYLTTKSGNNYAFCIIINDPDSTSTEMKYLEDYLIKEAYLRL